MRAHEQVELRSAGLLGIGNWALKLSFLGTQINRSARKLRLTKIFTLAIEERSIADGNLFQHFLSMERKRSERSGNSFMLVVLRIKDMLHSQDERKILGPLQRGIFSAIRNTDFVGWYEESQPELGILFTEIVEPNQVVASAIMKRVREAISAHTAPGLVKKMGVTCHVFRGVESNNSRSLERLTVAGD